MAHLIDKAAVVTGIKKLSAYLDSFHEQRLIEKIFSIIDTLEVKEVDLENEVESEYNPINGLSFEEYSSIAKHFFELGLKAGNSVDNKAQKEE